MSGTLNWLVVGLGDVALKRVLPALRAQARCSIRGAVTREPRRAESLGIRPWATLGDALADGGFDAVYVATPVDLHREHACAALHSGRHVLCEKPAAITHADAAAMVAEAESAGRLLGIAYFRRYYPKLRRARDLLAAGAIGTPREAFASCSEWLPEPDPRRGWLFDPARAGSGPLHDIGSHRIDALNFLLGEPVAAAASFFHGRWRRAVEDAATVDIRYARGAEARVVARWDTAAGLDEFRIVGTEGVLDLSPLSGAPLRSPAGEESLPCAANRHQPCIDAFVAAVLDGVPLECSGSACLPAAWVLDEAVREGRQSSA